MDKTIFYLAEAEKYTNSIIDISLADSFFEDTEIDKEINEQNEKAAKGAINAIKKAFNTIVEMIKNLITKISNFFKELFLNKEDAKKFKEFKEMMKKYPELKNVEVTIKDYQAYQEVFDDAMKKLEKENSKDEYEIDTEACTKILNDMDEQVNEINETVLDTLSDKAKGAAKGIAKRAVATVAIDTAVEMANRNATIAKTLKKALDSELIDIDALAKQAGDANATYFKKKIKKYAKNGFFHRCKVKIFMRNERTLESVLKHQWNKILSFTNYKNGGVAYGDKLIDANSVMSGSMKNIGMVTRAVSSDTGDSNVSTLKTLKAANDVRKDINSAKKSYKKTKKTVKDMKYFLTGK